MDLKLLREELEHHEGIRNTVYLDSLGYKTAGIGHLLTGRDGKLRVGTAVTAIQIEEWFAADVAAALVIAKCCLKNFNSLDAVRQRVMVNLAFNLGNRLLQFKNTLAHIDAGFYVTAACDLERSLWFKQVGRRGPEITSAMRTGQYALGK